MAEEKKENAESTLKQNTKKYNYEKEHADVMLGYAHKMPEALQTPKGNQWYDLNAMKVVYDT